jgi:opacity protein-like surface antigen
MKNRRACIALFAIAAALPGAADEPTWRHDVGLRVGGVGALPVFLPLAGSFSAFYEARSDHNWAVRPAIDVTKGREWGTFGYKGYAIDIDRVGAVVDFIYYTPSEKPIGTGFFLTAGVGWHRFDIKDDNKSSRYFQDQWVEGALRDTQGAASLSAGLGYQFGRMFGMEMKYSASGQDSDVADGKGKNWLTVSMNFRFPMPGQRKDEHPSDAIYRARIIAERARRTAERVEKIAEKAAESAEIDKLPPRKHKIGVSAGDITMQNEVANLNIFYENHLGGHWAIRPALEFTRGSDVYGDRPYRRPVDINSAGLAVDCVYYASKRRQNGTRFYMLAGLGAHWVSLKDELEALTYEDGTKRTHTEYSSVAPALSIGLGHYFGRYFGMEYKHTFSTLDSPFHGNVGKNWWRLTLNFRLPVPGWV